MRILIDSTQIQVGRTGVGLYAEQLIQKLALILEPQDKLYVLVQSDDTDLRKLIAKHTNLCPLLIPSSIFRNRLILTLYEQCILPWVSFYHQIDLIHSLHYTFPLLCTCLRIVTIHDMTHSLWPEMHTSGRRIAMSFFAKLAMRHAAGVLFVSESTKEDSERLFSKGHNFRAVTPLAVDYSAFDNIKPETIADTLLRLGIKRPYILLVGTLEPRKNIVRLIKAFDLISSSHPQHCLVIAGKLGWHYADIFEAIESSASQTRIHRLGYVSAEDKSSLIAGCDLLAYPSLYEGFGLPALEGMAAGVAVITSNVSSLPEITEGAAVLVDPYSVDQLATAINSILSNRKYREQLQCAGKKQARKFSWERTASLTYAAYMRIIGEPRP